MPASSTLIAIAQRPRVYTIWNARGRFAAFLDKHAMLMAFRTPEPAHTLAKAVEGYYSVTGHWPRLEFGDDSPFLYGAIAGPPRLVRVVDEDLEDLVQKCRADYLDMLVINELSIDNMLLMRGSVVPAPRDARPSVKYLKDKFAASLDIDGDGMAGLM